MEIFEQIVKVGLQYVWGFPEFLPWIIVVLLGAGLYITLRLAFVQLRQLKHAVLVTLGKYDDPDDPGDVNHFQALSTALSATVGIGNIAGVAIAVHIGGPGALVWMWLTALFGMALKFAECTLAMEYRDFDEKGDAAGGPMYYIEKGLGKAWKPLAIAFAFFAIISSFGGGNMNQANTVAQSAADGFGTPAWLVGAALVIIVGSVILGGIRSIAKVASGLAPTMALIYVAGALLILIMNASAIPGAFGEIFSSAFNPKAGVTGAGTGVFMTALLWGVRRGLFSNEAGQGSAPIAHAAAKTNEPVREGAVAMLGPLIDTLIICTMTGLIIVITGVWDKRFEDTKDFAGGRFAEVSMTLEVPDDYAGARDDNPEYPVRVINGTPPSALIFNHGELKAGKRVIDPQILVATDTGLLPLTGIVRVQKHPETGWIITGVEGVPRSVADSERPLERLKLKGKHLLTGADLTTRGYQEGLSPLGDWGGWVVIISVFLFAVSTIISWSYYGDRCVAYLFGARYVIVYRLVYLVFVYLGATFSLKIVWDYGDLALGLMTVPNLIAVVLLAPRVVEMSRDYFRRMADGKVPAARAKREADKDE